MVEWQRAFGSVLPLEYLTPLNEFATFYPNPNDPNGTPFKVVRKRNGEFKAIHREHRISVQPGDVQFYRWNIRLFRNHVASSLGLASASDIVNPEDCLIRLGNYQLSPSKKYPVYWIRAANYRDFQSELQPLQLKHSSSFFLMTGTWGNWGSEAEDTLRARNSPLIALPDILEFRDGQFVATDVWRDAVEVFHDTLRPKNMVAVPDYLFAKQGGWEIRFGDEKMSYGDDLYGLDYIQHLLKYPFQLIHGSEIESTSRKNKSCGGRSAFSQNEMKSMPEEEIPVGSSSQSYDDNGIIDRKAKEQYEQRLRELAQDRRNAYAVSDLAWLKKIDTEFQAIDSELNKSKSIFGKTAKLDKSEKLLVDRVAKNIRVAIGKISIQMPKFSQYLENTIHPGRFSHYLPHENIDWIFS